MPYDKEFVSEVAKPAPKRIIVGCDGTWQSAVSLNPKNGVPSNVTRLLRVLAKAGTDLNGKVWQQIVYYDAGVGTGGVSGVEGYRQGGLGIGLTENVMEAYNFIVNNYCPGDELFFFGFSRGAYTVRSAAALVATVGVVKPIYMPDFMRIYHGYTSIKSASSRAPSFAQHPDWVKYINEKPDYAISNNANVQIKVIGVWDTVGALGVPDVGHWWTWNNQSWREKYEFHDVQLNERVDFAYQALALDEQRAAFSPSVWKLTNKNKHTKLCQCWFPGAHINVGGGNNPDTGDREQLASISYAWMLDRVHPHLAFDIETFNEQLAVFEELANAQAERMKEGEGWITWAWNKVAGGSEKVLPEGYALGKIEDSHTLMYSLMSSRKPRTPGAYHCNDKTKKRDSEDWMFTTERIHPSVHLRQLATTPKRGETHKKYEPIAMENWERILEKKIDPDGTVRYGWQWVKWNKDKTKKEVCLWEFQIGKMPKETSAEYRLLKKSWAGTEVWEKVKQGWGKPVGAEN